MASKAGMSTGIEVARISVKVSPDTKKFRVELQQELNEIERTMKGDVHIKAHLDGAQAKADFERLKAAMQKNGRIKLGVDMVAGNGKGGGSNSGSNGGGGRGGRGGGGKDDNNGFFPGSFGKSGNLIPNFGSGINAAGYVAILGAAALVAAPLIGLLSTAVLAIPGLISAVATPFMAITLGLDGIKKAASESGLFSLDKKGKIDGLGAVFDPIKTEVSKAFDEGLAPSLKAVANAIQPLLGSLPRVATGLTDMFKGFTDSLTSTEGIALFDQTIQNIGKAMSDAAPGVKDFTTGMMQLATSFTSHLPQLSTWFNKTGSDFVKWVTKMTTVPDPAGAHGPDPNGKTPLDTAFEGLGATLETIGAWIVDMGKAGLEFVSDPKKMSDFIGVLNKIGEIITGLVNLGNKLGPVWDLLNQLGLLKATPDAVPTPGPKPGDKGAEIPTPAAPADAPTPDKGFWGTLRDFIDGPGSPGAGGVQLVIGDQTVPGNASPEQIAGVVKSETDRLNAEIATLEGAIAARTTGGFKQASSDAVNQYKEDLAKLKDDLAALQAEAELIRTTDVALKSSENTSLFGSAGFGATGANALAPVPVPAPVTAPDVSAIPKAGEDAMGELAAAITAGGAAAQAAAQGVADGVKATFDTAGASMIASGLNIARGLAAGITAGTSTVINAAIGLAQAAIDASNKKLEINSPSKVFMGIGESVGEGLGKGMENGFQPVLDQARELSGQISDAFNSGGDPTGLLSGFSDEESSRMGKVLSFQSHKLTRQAKDLDRQFKATGDQRFKDQADSLRGQIDQLAEQKDSLSLASEYADLTNPKKRSGDSNPFVASIKELMKMPSAFATATAGQAMQDLNMSGDGALQAVAGWGMDFAQKGVTNIFNTSNVPDTIALSDNQTARESQGLVGRGN